MQYKQFRLPFVRGEVRGNIGNGDLLTGLDDADRGEDEGESILVPAPFGIGGTAVGGSVRKVDKHEG